jgi:DNA mismatch endonuclease (patch repair protein)
MSRIRGKDTGPERVVGALLTEAGHAPEQHVSDLPGRPDFVLRDLRVAIFVDGDFWHGWRFIAWKHKLSEKWEAKIAANRRRDFLNHARLRRAGWRVLRIWQHQIERDLESVKTKIASLENLRP